MCFRSPVRLWILSVCYLCSAMVYVVLRCFRLSFSLNFNLFNSFSFWFHVVNDLFFSLLHFSTPDLHSSKLSVPSLSFLSFCFLHFSSFSLSLSSLSSLSIYSVLLHHSTRCITNEKINRQKKKNMRRSSFSFFYIRLTGHYRMGTAELTIEKCLIFI